MRTIIKACMRSNFGRIPQLTTELVALEHLKKTSYNLVRILAPSFLFGSSSFLLRHVGSQVSDRCPLGYLSSTYLWQLIYLSHENCNNNYGNEGLVEVLCLCLLSKRKLVCLQWYFLNPLSALWQSILLCFKPLVHSENPITLTIVCRIDIACILTIRCQNQIGSMICCQNKYCL